MDKTVIAGSDGVVISCKAQGGISSTQKVIWENSNGDDLSTKSGYKVDQGSFTYDASWGYQTTTLTIGKEHTTYSETAEAYYCKFPNLGGLIGTVNVYVYGKCFSFVENRKI